MPGTRMRYRLSRPFVHPAILSRVRLAEHICAKEFFRYFVESHNSSGEKFIIYGLSYNLRFIVCSISYQ